MNQSTDSGRAASRLGFGTSTLMARLSARESLRALETAFDEGITHFDTARMYGYGEAEALLGRFIRDKRGEVTVTTKAGIVPPKRSMALSALRTIARGMVAVAPGLRRAVRRQAEKTISSGCFDPAVIRASLETSLRELAVERIDFFLLHECDVGDLSDELVEVLRDAVAAGKIGSFGIGTTQAASKRILAERPEFADVVQLPNSIETPAGTIIDQSATVITHSIFRGDAARIAAHLEQNALAVPGLPMPTLVRRAMLEYALRSNRRGVTIFSSSRPQHIIENAQAARERLFTDQQLGELAKTLACVGTAG